jgi:hypothetical protein
MIKIIREVFATILVAEKEWRGISFKRFWAHIHPGGLCFFLRSHKVCIVFFFHAFEMGMLAKRLSFGAEE